MCCRLEGTAIHIPGKDTMFVGDWSTKSIGLNYYAASTQPGIVEHLVAECERVYPDSITVSYGMRAVGGNVCAGELVVEDSAGERHERQFDMIVGADGVQSAVRQLMQEHVRRRAYLTCMWVMHGRSWFTNG